MINKIAISGYRSLRDLIVELDPLTIITGGNGSGKSSLYRALRLLSEVGQGRAISSLAKEGGLESTLWAGPEKLSAKMKSGEHEVQGTVRSARVALKLGFEADNIGYAINLGLPAPSHSRFFKDPEIKMETVWTGGDLTRSNIIAERNGPFAKLRSFESGEWRRIGHELSTVDSLLTHCADAQDGLELLHLRDRVRDWRFYDHFRVDADAPARKPQIGTYTPVLAGDGADVGAAIQTIFELGEKGAFDDAIADAFDGAALDIGPNFEVQMHQHGLLRPLSGAELSDGTLRYILLSAALFSPRPPELMILNEPEASLHPQLLAPLGRMMAKAAERCQLVVVSHAEELVDTLQGRPNNKVLTLEKELGETRVAGMTIIDRPKWTWPSR